MPAQYMLVISCAWFTLSRGFLHVCTGIFQSSLDKVVLYIVFISQGIPHSVLLWKCKLQFFENLNYHFFVEGGVSLFLGVALFFFKKKKKALGLPFKSPCNLWYHNIIKLTSALEVLKRPLYILYLLCKLSSLHWNMQWFHVLLILNSWFLELN